MTSTTVNVANQLKRYLEKTETDPSALEETSIVQALFDAKQGRFAKKLKEMEDEVVNVTQQMAVKDGELAVKDGELDAKDKELTAKDKELAAKVEELETKDTKIAELDNVVNKIRAKFYKCKNDNAAQVASLEAQIVSLKKRNDDLTSDMELTM